MITWHFGLTTFSEYHKDGWIGYQPDYFGEENAGGPPLEAVSPYGFLGRPADPDVDPLGKPTRGAGLLYLYDGDEGFGFPTSDPRIIERLPELKRGESMQYGGAGQFVRCHADGSISLYTTDDGTPTGHALYVSLSPTDGFEVSTPWGRMMLGPLGFHVIHSSGAHIDLGAIGGLPGPLAAFSSYAKIEAGITSIKGGAVSVGTDGGATSEAATTVLATFLEALVTAISSINTGTTGATAMAPIAAQLPAVHAAILQIGKVV